MFKSHIQGSIIENDDSKFRLLRKCVRCGKEFETKADDIYCSFACFYKIPNS